MISASVVRSAVQRPPFAILFLFAALFLSLPAAAQEGEPYPVGPEGGSKLAAALRSMRPEENSRWQGQLKITRNRQTLLIPAASEVMVDGPAWKVIYTAPATDKTAAEKLIVAHSPNGPNEYFYAKALSPSAILGEPKPLSAAGIDFPFANSDFWLSDLGFEFYHWPDQRCLKGEMRRGRSCYVLESRNPNPPPQGYSRVVSWIDRESAAKDGGGIILAEAYGPDNRKLKEFSLGPFTKVRGHWELKWMEIVNLRANSRTRLEFDLDSK
jgi:hypothetical protein